MSVEPVLGNPPGMCSFYLPKKRRYCKMRAKEGAKYCGEHSIIIDHDRISCPFDPNQYRKPPNTSCSC